MDGLQLTTSYFSPEEPVPFIGRRHIKALGAAQRIMKGQEGRLPGLKGWDNDLPDSTQF